MHYSSAEFIYEEKIPVLFNKLKEEQRKSSALNLQEDFYFFQVPCAYIILQIGQTDSLRVYFSYLL